MTPELAVLDTSSKTPGVKPKLGSKAWADRIRNETKTLARTIDTDYLRLAQNLWAIFDTPVDNDPKNTSWVTKWGYGHIADYEVEELGLHKKQAERLRKMWKVLGGAKLKEAINDEMMSRIISLGRSKVRELTRLDDLLTKKNLDSWVSKAEKMTFLGLAEEVKTCLAGRDGVMKGDLGKIEPEDDDGYIEEPEVDPHDAPPPASYKKPLSKLAHEAAADIAKESQKTIFSKPPDEVEEKPTYRTYGFYPDQLDTVNAALERSGQMSGSKVDGHNLSLICLDFLATNDFKKGDMEQVQRFLIRIEKALNLKLIAVTPKDREIVYGYKLLEKIIKD